MNKPKHAGGRPTKYNLKLAKEICDTISTNTKGLKKLCNEREHWPTSENLRQWCLRYPEFRAQYVKAKTLQCDWLAEEALEIAYDGSKDTYIDDKGIERIDHEWIQRSKLIVDTIKWKTAKLAPKIYGDQKKDDESKQVTLMEKIIDKL